MSDALVAIGGGLLLAAVLGVLAGILWLIYLSVGAFGFFVMMFVLGGALLVIGLVTAK